MNFGGWIPFDDASATAPDWPGVLQARADALRAYPKGRSAMVLYACCRPDETLRDYITGRGAPRLRVAAALGARWIRFASSPVPGADFDRALDRLLGRFLARFGAAPAANDGDGSPQDPEHRHQEERASDG